MTLKVFFVTSLFTIYLVLSDDVYRGTSFPKKYLEPDDIVPSVDDTSYYLEGIKKIIGAMGVEPNKTDPSGGLAFFFMGAILKRTLKENGEYMRDDHFRSISEILKHTDVIMSHFHYPVKKMDWSDVFKRVTNLFLDDSLQVEAIAEYNTKKLNKYILSETKINNFAQAMDEITLSKDKYAALVEDTEEENYTINVHDSDFCLGQIIYNPVYNKKKHKSCISNYCSKIVYTSPSIAYGLSHRLLVIMMMRHLRRCYIRSEKEDDELMDELCASMYREAVYLARRGYFYRDLFMEHVALCSFLGYKEFHRRHWYQKVASWIDNEGCIQENMNFEYNRTRVLLEKADTEAKRERLLKISAHLKSQRCFYHQMVLGAIMLAHGVRYSVNFGINYNLFSVQRDSNDTPLVVTFEYRR